MNKQSVLALLFALNFLEASYFGTITTRRQPETSTQISGEDFKHSFVLKISLIQANEWNRRFPHQLSSENHCFIPTKEMVS